LSFSLENWGQYSTPNTETVGMCTCVDTAMRLMCLQFICA